MEASCSQLLPFIRFTQKNTLFSLTAVLSFCYGKCSTYTQQAQFGRYPLFCHVLVFNILSELSEVGLVKSCLEKEGSNLPQVTEEQNVVILTENEMDLLQLSRHRGCYDW